MCTIIVNDDRVFEGVESFQVELSMPVYALLGGNTRAVVHINDTEDEPTLQFDKKAYHVNESSGLVHVPVERTGRPPQLCSPLPVPAPNTPVLSDRLPPPPPSLRRRLQHRLRPLLHHGRLRPGQQPPRPGVRL